MTPMTREEFLLERGLRCPVCRSVEIDHTDTFNDVDLISYNYLCANCLHEWFAEFRLTDYSYLEEYKDE